jgi:hypothetical protein
MALNGILLSAGVLVNSPESLDSKYGPFNSTTEALNEIPQSLRYPGLTVGVKGLNGQVTEYWFKDGTNLIEKTAGGSSDLPAFPADTDTHLLLYDADTGVYWEKMEVSTSPDVPELPGGVDTHMLLYDADTGIYWEKMEVSTAPDLPEFPPGTDTHMLLYDADTGVWWDKLEISYSPDLPTLPAGPDAYILIYDGNTSPGLVWEKVTPIVSSDNFVSITGNESISGIKNFYDRPTVTGSEVLVSGDFEEVCIDDLNIVYTTGDQSVTGLKNFNTRPQVNGVNVLLAGEGGDASLDISSIVYTTGNATISGTKNFITRPTVNGTAVLLSGEATNSNIDTSNIVYTTGNATISGMKTFASTIYGAVSQMGATIPLNRNLRFVDAYAGYQNIAVDGTGVYNFCKNNVLTPWMKWDIGNTNPYTIKLLNDLTSTPQIAIGTDSPHSSALVDLTSTKGGLLLPRMTETQKSNITSPASGLILYNITSGTPEYYNGTAWNSFGGGSTTIDTTNFVTTNTTQTISSNKNFTIRPTVNNSGVLLQGEASTPISRASVSTTTASIAASGTTTVDLNFGCKSYSILSITSNATGSWVKVYYNSSDRTADAARTIDQDPSSAIGLMAESLAITTNPVRFSPGTIGYNDGTNTTVPISITNTRASSSAYTITLNYLKLEM